MSLDNVALRATTLDDLTGIAAIYNQLWCNTLRNRGDVEDRKSTRLNSSHVT